jgi:hypothetical protein
METVEIQMEALGICMVEPDFPEIELVMAYVTLLICPYSYTL